MRQMLLGCPVDILTMAETLELVRDSIRKRKRLQHVALNVAKLVNMRRNPLLTSDIVSSDLIGIDGVGILWAARLLGLPAEERVAGIDLFDQSLALCEQQGFKPYFLGATQQIVQEAASRALQRYPKITFAGVRDGYFRPEKELDIVNEIRASGADCLFIGMPTPYKERFLASYRDQLDVPFVMGVGGSFDVLAGKVRRAPARMRVNGLEWLYRVYQEPRRMWWRYAKTNTLFIVILTKALIDRYIHARPRTIDTSAQIRPVKTEG